MSRAMESAIEATKVNNNELIATLKKEVLSARKINEVNENESRNCKTSTSVNPTFAAMRRRRHHGGANSSARAGTLRKRKRRRATTENGGISRGGIGSTISGTSLSNVPSTSPSTFGFENNDCYSPSSYSSESGSSSSEYGGSSSEGEEEDSMFEQELGINYNQTKTVSANIFLNNVDPINNEIQKNGTGSKSISAQKSSVSNNSNKSNAYDSTSDKSKQSNIISSSTPPSTPSSTNSNSNLNSASSSPRQSPNSNLNTNTNGEQSSGWRVKLYRLNADGSWEDCGTGRITCTFTYSDSNNSSISSDSSNSSNYSDDAQLYRELGEPTLCMRSELPPSLSNSSATSNDSSPVSVSRISEPKILLNTRILLRQVYNRQGDNIITWCEPTFETLENIEAVIDDAEIDGVDLALSFQDNAGCLDIWRQITEVQERAAQLVRHRDVSNALNPSSLLENSDYATPTSSSNSQTPNQTTSLSSNIMSNGLHHTNVSHDSNHSLQSNSRQNEHNDDSDDAPNTISDGQSSISTNAMQLTSDSMEATHQAQLHHHQQQISQHMYTSTNASYNEDELYPESNAESAAVSMVAVAAAALGTHNSSVLQQQQNTFDVTSLSRQLPKNPSLSNLEEISDIFAASQIQQREALATFLSDNNCSYVKALLALFPSAEKKDDFRVLATLAASIKSILLLNDPTIVELIAVEEEVFENVCCALEYDPDLKMKANHRWFMRERVKFKTVVEMDDEEVISAIHRSFRVNYLRDTLLRPTMDESSLSTLASLLQFTQAEVVRGVTFYPPSISAHDEEQLHRRKKDSYLMKVLRLLGKEIKALREAESELILNSLKNTDESIVPKEQSSRSEPKVPLNSGQNALLESTLLKSNSGKTELMPLVSNVLKEKVNTSLWRQHLVPQDSSLSSRRIRRQGCLSFLRELFSMVRGSLQQNAKDDYYAMIVFMDIDLNIDDDLSNIVDENSLKESNSTNPVPSTRAVSVNQTKDVLKDQVNILSLMSATISDPHSEISDRGAALEILSSIVMHDPSLVRRHCLDEYTANISRISNDDTYPSRPEPDEKGQVLFICGPDDLLLSLLYLMAVETDAGLLLQTSEILRIIFDTEMIDQGALIGCVEDESSTISGIGSSEQNKFLSLFYEHYVPWLIAPFQYTILISQISAHAGGTTTEKRVFHQCSRKSCKCAIRSSFSVDLLCFCVKAPSLRMKFFVRKNRVLNCVLKLMDESEPMHTSGGYRCLKLACLRFFRAILSLKDEFYYRLVIQHKLFEPIFQAFRLNPVGDNLISSAIIEICDFILSENIKPLIEHIVTKHLTNRAETDGFSPRSSSLEDVSTPYVNTLTLLRKKYEENINGGKKSTQGEASNGFTFQNGVTNEQSYFMNIGMERIGLTGKALEDQRKFRENDEEDSYFNTDDDDEDNMGVGKTSESDSESNSLTSIGPTQISSIRENGQESDVERDIQFQVKLGLAMVQYSSSSDEDEDDILSGERSGGANDSDLLGKATKRSHMGRGKRQKIQVVVNTKNKNQQNSLQPTEEVGSASLNKSNVNS